jgi:hypothetical protein
MSIDTHIIRASSAHRGYVDRILTAALEMARGDGLAVIAEHRRGPGGEHEYWLGVREPGHAEPPAVTGPLGVASAVANRGAEVAAQATVAARAVPQPPSAPSKPLWPNDRQRPMRLATRPATGRANSSGGAA